MITPSLGQVPVKQVHLQNARGTMDRGATLQYALLAIKALGFSDPAIPSWNFSLGTTPNKAK